LKKILQHLCFILCLASSCAKTPENINATNGLSNRVFVPVSLFGSVGNWGGGVCSWGFIMIRQDSTVTYHSRALPANVTIPNTPILVSIQFHDTVQISNCWHEIVVDSIKF
jgi:hypothetical protein